MSIRTAVRLAFFAVILPLLPVVASAHQPRIVQGSAPTVIDQPEVSKAYYDNLRGSPHAYVIDAGTGFLLYANLLVPKTEQAPIRVRATIYRIDASRQLIGVLDDEVAWKDFFDPFGHDHYLQGPTYEKKVPSGRYEIDVSDADNRGKYVLAVGKRELFPLPEVLRALSVVPQLKSDFFGVPRATFLFSPFGLGEVAFLLIVSFLCGWLVHNIAKRFARKRSTLLVGKNINSRHRLLRLGIGIFLLIAGLFFWSTILFFLAGFCLFEAFSGWCAVFALLGKNSCVMPDGFHVKS
jgi:hypothetical protein